MSISSWGKRSRRYLGDQPYGALTNTLNCTQKLTESYCTVCNTNIAVAAFTNQHAGHYFLISRIFYVVFRGRPTALQEFIHFVIREWVKLFYLLVILSTQLVKKWDVKGVNFKRGPELFFFGHSTHYMKHLPVWGSCFWKALKSIVLTCFWCGWWS